MEYFITIVGLLIFNNDENWNRVSSFYVKWDDVQHFRTSQVEDRFTIDFILKYDEAVKFNTYDKKFYLKLIKDLNSQMMTEVMWNEKQAEIEVNCGK